MGQKGTLTLSSVLRQLTYAYKFTTHARQGSPRNISRRVQRAYVGMGDQSNTSALCYREKDPVGTVEEAGWAPTSVWTSIEKRKSLAHTGTRTADCPSHNKSLCRLVCSTCSVNNSSFVHMHEHLRRPSRR
jgi:hypothetical protein